MNTLINICYGMLYGLAAIIFYCYSSDSDYEFGDDASYSILLCISLVMGFVLLVSVIIKWDLTNFIALLCFAALTLKLSFDGIWLFDWSDELEESIDE